METGDPLRKRKNLETVASRHNELNSYILIVSNQFSRRSSAKLPGSWSLVHLTAVKILYVFIFSWDMYIELNTDSV